MSLYIRQADQDALAADLNDYLNDTGYLHYAAGPEVVAGIAEFIGEWLDGTVQERKDDYARRHAPRSIAVEAAIVVQRDQEQLSLHTARQQERKDRRAAKVLLDGDRLRVIQRRAPPRTPKV